MAQVDVPRSAQRGQAQAQGRHAADAQEGGAWLHRGHAAQREAPTQNAPGAHCGVSARRSLRPSTGG
eukprot:5154747-Lingulodinium_polyedra.AAC.1